MNLNIDVVKILTPISSAQPAGCDLRTDHSARSPYFAIKDARQQARNIERSLMQGQTEMSADPLWRSVQKNCLSQLMHSSKDLELAAWLTEALVRQHGLTGLAMGFEIMHGLLDKFWDSFYPEIEDGDVESRLSPLIGLNGDDSEGVLIAPIRQLAITQGKSCGPFALWQYQQALTQTTDTSHTASPNTMSLAQIKKAVAESSAEFYQQLQKDVHACQDNYRRIEQIFTAQCADTVPRQSYILEVLAAFADHINFILTDAPFSPAATTANPDRVTGPKSLTKPTHHPLPTAIVNREQALSLLAQIVDYFQQTEPHSPIPYLLERAINWSQLTLAQLLPEIIADDKTRLAVCQLTGIKNNA